VRRWARMELIQLQQDCRQRRYLGFFPKRVSG
jgi:hypothetical protein